MGEQDDLPWLRSHQISLICVYLCGLGLNVKIILSNVSNALTLAMEINDLWNYWDLSWVIWLSFNWYNKHDQTHGTALDINQVASVKACSERFFQLSQESTSPAGAGVDAKGSPLPAGPWLWCLLSTAGMRNNFPLNLWHSGIANWTFKIPVLVCMWNRDSTAQW